MAGGFGAVAGLTVLYLAEGIPRVQKDILQVRRCWSFGVGWKVEG